MPPRTFSVIITFLLMAGFVAEAAPEAGTGIEGVITISPARPGPIRADAPDSAALANATWVVKNERGDVAAEFTTDAQGHFRAELPPGRYTVSLKGKKSGIGKFGPFTVEVVPGAMTKVQWQCDSGMR
jgi:hypothetical protein